MNIYFLWKLYRMSNFSQLPQNISLPSELAVSNIDPAMPPDARSNSIRVYATNNPTITGTFSTGAATSITLGDLAFPQSQLVFDIPVSQSPDTWLDTRLSTISFRAIVSVGTAGNIALTTATLKSSAYSYFSGLSVNGQNGGQLENISELGLVADTILQAQMSNSSREGLFNFGFKSNLGLTGAAAGNPVFSNTGHDIPILTKAPVVANDSVSYNYSIPLLSSTVGVLADKMFPVGLTKKLSVILTTDSILPLTLATGATGTTASTFTITLTDFFLNLEMIKIGDSAMSSIVSSLHDGKMYLHGQTYRTTTSLIPAGSTGSITLPCGITGTSVRSLFTRFSETANKYWGKYNSTNPSINNFTYNIGGLNYPPSSYSPSLYPSLAWRNFLIAMGTFNATQFASGITALTYCRLAKGGAATTGSSNHSSSQDALFLTDDYNTVYQGTFMLGESLETVPKRGLISGKDLTFQKVNLQLGLALANTNAINVYVIALMDTITVVDIHSGDVITLL